MKPLLEVRDLVVEFDTARGRVRAVDGVSFSVARGRTLALVGESGCGKSVTALSLMRLIPSPPGHIVRGSVMLGGVDMLALDEEKLRAMRGAKLSMVFQEPMTSLNPVFTVGEQIAEALRLHKRMKNREALDEAARMLAKVGIADPVQRLRAYPHQLSGGMRQRVMLAMALCCGPDLLIADEPTTALDVTIQAQLMDLLAALRRESAMGLLLITHDLGLVSENADDVAVMYAGRIVEQATAADLFRRPRHPYTVGLMRSIPSHPSNVRGSPLATIPGSVPSLHEMPAGCRFRDRCPRAIERCAVEEPALDGEGHLFRCHNPVPVEDVHAAAR